MKKVVAIFLCVLCVISAMSMIAVAGDVSKTVSNGTNTATGRLNRYSSRTRFTMTCTSSTASLAVSGTAYESASVGGGSLSISIGGSGKQDIGETYYPVSGYSFTSATATYTASGFSSFTLTT